MTFGGDRGQGDGTGQTPEDGQPAEGGEMPQPPTDGGPVNMDNMFSDETTTIQLTDATKIVSVTFENNEIVEKTVTLADLKADDILSINLKDDTLEAESITIRTGGFGGGGGRQRPNEQQQQSL
ncbi:hypothetical protein [Paenibacillus harenae]|uniref:DUF5666 domain-containing protein n=1 Tax=Paenibacillus harenae TaxID=306543 RepID=A0ABT9U9B1_PAEHA|nr:hypothetical protein [Paenibacillus harenae]MDQ0115285.1 hypothetical protein [Paenibacillus harenae]